MVENAREQNSYPTYRITTVHTREANAAKNVHTFSIREYVCTCRVCDPSHQLPVNTNRKSAMEWAELLAAVVPL